MHCQPVCHCRLVARLPFAPYHCTRTRALRMDAPRVLPYGFAIYVPVAGLYTRTRSITHLPCGLFLPTTAAQFCGGLPHTPHTFPTYPTSNYPPPPFTHMVHAMPMPTRLPTVPFVTFDTFPVLQLLLPSTLYAIQPHLYPSCWLPPSICVVILVNRCVAVEPLWFCSPLPGYSILPTMRSFIRLFLPSFNALLAHAEHIYLAVTHTFGDIRPI